jgi:hypothetical protein
MSPAAHCTQALEQAVFTNIVCQRQNCILCLLQDFYFRLVFKILNSELGMVYISVMPVTGRQGSWFKANPGKVSTGFYLKQKG